eukprot:CAMPEP_0176495726 /NCGR_PEP_ID=MMETSP0200_2-20121128/10816_1 /TAXON_ID=947934 /ORGANISM="Chaetoceros sp., Strain GSL56" /LENGTH=227 /DNA_ID=CAMNT_0017893635 /DNA_START=97 /DNA_END=780 /DNA_ORIENTATION=-
MSGLGRRSHYRKHLTDSVLNDFPEPNPPYERIAKVIGTRGSNQFELVVDPRDDILDETPQLAILPTKFRKLVWLKRNDYVICAVAQEDEAAGDAGSSTTHRGKNHEGGIRYMIEHILYKDQVKHLKEKGLWPKHEFFWDEKNNISRDNDDDDDDDDQGKGCKRQGDEEEDARKEETYDNNSDVDHGDIEEEDGIVYNNIDEEYFCNMNRVAKMKVADSSEDESEDSD